MFLSTSSLLIYIFISYEARFFRIVGDWEMLSPNQRHLFHWVTPSLWPFFAIQLKYIFLKNYGISKFFI